MKSLEIPCAPNHETEDGRPRSPDGRGPHPLGELEPGLRLALGGDFRRLAGVKLVRAESDHVVLSVLTEAKRAELVRHCQAAILETAGVTRLEFEFAIVPAPPKLRRMP